MQNPSEYITYRSLLVKKQGKGFSEIEVTDILRQILSQLTRLHDLRQAHGAISLDTVVYDTNRRQIVLLRDTWMNHPIYLASEVAQSRKATPSADIYALGVFTIVLLTGRSPEELKSSDNEWNWEEHCTVSNRFIQMLNMALFDETEFRYINAGQMLRSLQPVLAHIETKIASPAPPIIIVSPLPESPPVRSTIFPPPPVLNRSATKFSKSQRPPSILNSSESVSESFTDSLNIEPLDFEMDDSKIQLKADLPNSSTYRKTTFSSKNISKSTSKTKLHLLFIILLGLGVGGIATAYVFIQSKPMGNKSIQSNNQAANSLVPPESDRLERINLEKTRIAQETTNKLIASAQVQYENTGSLNEAKMILQEIPSNNPMRPKIDLLIKQWQDDTKKNNSLIKQAEISIANGKWQQAIDTVKGLASTPYWQKRSKMISENAKQQLAKKISEPAPIYTPNAPSPSVSEPIQEPLIPVPDTIPSYSAAPPPSQRSAEPIEAPPPPRAAN